MAQALTYSQIISILEDIARRSYKINSFFLGQDWELAQSEAPVYPCLQVYPLTSVMPISVMGDYKSVVFEIQCKLLDLVGHDQFNQKSVHNDLHAVAQSIVNEINQNPYFVRSFVKMVGDVQFVNLEEVNDDFLAGWGWIIRFEIRNLNTFCGQAFEPVDGYSMSGPSSSGYSPSVRYLTCDTVTGCTTFQDYIQNAIDGVVTDNYYTTGGTLVGTTIQFDRNDLLNAYEVQLSGLTSGITATGNYLSLSGGTVTGNTVFTQTVDAGTIKSGVIISGSTNLYDIFSSTSANLWSASTGTNSIIANNGTGNLASGFYSFAGGQNNSATTIHSISVGGKSNLAEGNYSVIVGGSYNTTLQSASFIGAGGNNLASAQNSVVVGGSTNTSSGNNSAIVGGIQNLASAQNSFVGGGYGNSATTTYSFVGGGYKNLASGNYSSVVGGRNNTASGAYSMAAGSGNIVSGTNSAVLGGTGITGTTNNSVYIPNAYLASMSGTRIYSAGTDLYNIFQPLGASGGASTFVQPGTNISTGGTSDEPIVSVVDSPSFNNITYSGTSTGRIAKRVVVVPSSATPTLNTSVCDIARLTGLTVAITNASTNLTGNPVHGDMFSYEITDNGTGRAITWGASFAASGTLSLPTTTIANTMLKVLFQYNAASSLWVITAWV